jgi:hypothetical protein
MGVAVAGDVADAVWDDRADATELKSALAAMSIASERMRTCWAFMIAVPPETFVSMRETIPQAKR